MSSKHSGHDADRSPDDKSVGYGRPPVENRFKPGGPSPNPYGRRGKPRPTCKNGIAAHEQDFLDEFVTITVDGKPKRVTRDRYLDHVLFLKASGGDVAAARRLDERRMDRERRAEAQAHDTVASAAAGNDSDFDDAIVKRALRRLSTNGISPDVDELSGASDEPCAPRRDDLSEEASDE